RGHATSDHLVPAQPRVRSAYPGYADADQVLPVARIRPKGRIRGHATPDLQARPRVRFAYPGYMLDYGSGKARGRGDRPLRSANAHEDVDIGRAVAEGHFLGLQVGLVL